MDKDVNDLHLKLSDVVDGSKWRTVMRATAAHHIVYLMIEMNVNCVFLIQVKLCLSASNKSVVVMQCRCRRFAV